MYNKTQIKHILEKDDRLVEDSILDDFIKKNKLDPIYEDENGVEYFDEIALDKIKHNINLSSKNVSENIAHLAHEVTPLNNSAVVHARENYEGAELKKITLDITNQTLSVLAETIAGKITADVADHIKKTDFFEPALETGALKRDNEILAQQVDKLLEENKRLINKVKDLETENKKYKLIAGTIYWKID